jgi:hypothetical protein
MYRGGVGENFIDRNTLAITVHTQVINDLYQAGIGSTRQQRQIALALDRMLQSLRSFWRSL